jgi:predicted MFS family arabinose efflux permease
MLALFRQRNFALLWVGGLVSYIGNRMLATALPFYIYQQTGSTIATALMTVVGILPVVFLGTLSGVYVDRWNLKRLLVITNLLQMGTTLLLLLVPTEQVLWIVYIVALVQALLSTFQTPAENVLLPRLVGQEDLMSANALNSLNDNLARLIGPPLGGLLLGLWGLESVVIINSFSFLWAATLVWLMILPDRGVSTQVSGMRMGQGWLRFWREWREGLEAVRQDPLVLTLMVVLAATGFAGTMLSPLYPAFAESVLGIGAAGFGLILTAQAVGGIIGGILLGQGGKHLSAITMLVWGNILVGGLLLLQFNVALFPVALMVAFLIGPEQVAVSVGLQTLLQQRVPAARQGRVFGTMGTTGALFGLLGASLAGPLGVTIGVVPALNIAAGITIAVGVGAMFVLPRIATE